MKNFLISVNITIRVPVQANDLYAAVAIAEAEARARCPGARMYTYTFNDSRELVDDGFDGAAQDMAAGLIKSVGQTCVRCGHTAHRDAWGPGWVRCPACLEFAPSAAEQQQEIAEAKAKQFKEHLRDLFLLSTEEI